MSRGAGAVLYYKDANQDSYVLVGNESRYLQDSIHTKNLKHPDTGETLTKDALREYQRANVTNRYEARAIFHERAKKLSEQLGEHVRYDTPKQRSDGTYSCHYRTLNTENVGIIKGHAEAGEYPIHTAVREVEEELGFSIQAQPVTLVDRMVGNCEYYLFTIYLTKDLYDRIVSIMEARNKDTFGEMFDLRFVSVKMNKAERDKFNNPSKFAINFFPNYFLVFRSFSLIFS